MKTIKQNQDSEYTVKKSRFIANIFPVNSIEEAEKQIKAVNKKYYDAKHNCYAYIVENYEKCSDDGEPSGTAGSPILDLIKRNKLSNVLIVVTRYFGGILLGTGGLVRAYTDSAKGVIDKSETIEKKLGLEYSIKVSYDQLKNTLYWCNKFNVEIMETKYEDEIEIIMQSTDDEKSQLLANINILGELIINKNDIWINM